jgi:Oxidoreductase family, NAD-binding Rossmann fold/Oxidoreductase family, C-terminal alpha/beta domain
MRTDSFTPHRGPSRRRFFFFGSLLTGTVPAGDFGSVPSLRALGYKPFYDKLNVAAIGCGGQGGVDLNDAAKTENIVALCDVDDSRASLNFAKFEKQPKYKDYRRLLDREGRNIDAVTIGIPDFMHATVALACMQMGKHVYCEKPLTRTPWEARMLQQAAARYKVATQMGNQGFSHECNRVAAEIVWSGAIGDVTEAHICTIPGTSPVGLRELPPEEAAPATLDWPVWLGSAPMRPFSSSYAPYNWRGFLDFGTGQIGNWATHIAGPVQMALQLGAPTRIERISVTGESRITYPASATVRIEFPARGPMAPVTVYYHEAVTAQAEAFRVPGMEKETILPPPNNLTEKGRPMADRRRVPAAGGPPPQPSPGSGRFGVRNFLDPTPPPLQPGLLTGNGSLFIGAKGMMTTVDSWRRRPSTSRCAVG